MYYPIANITLQPISYSQIRCIALRVLQTSKEFWVFLFRPNSMVFASLQGHPDCGLSLTSNK